MLMVACKTVESQLTSNIQALLKKNTMTLEQGYQVKKKTPNRQPTQTAQQLTMHSNELCLFKYKSILPKTKIEIGGSANPPIEASMGATAST